MYGATTRRGTATMLAVLLLLAGLAALHTAQAEPESNMYIDFFDYDIEHNTPPRAGLPHPVLVYWVNDGPAVTDATIAIELDGDLLNETEGLDFGANSTGIVSLNITFPDVGEAKPLAYIDYYDNTTDETDEDDNTYEGWFNVEPTNGEAELSVDLDPNGNLPPNVEPGDNITVEWNVQITAEVSPGYPDKRITLGLYVDPDDGSAPSNLTASYDYGVGFFSPDLPPEGEMGSIVISAPATEGRYVLTVVIDIDGNNSDTDNINNNYGDFYFCVGDCSQPDLTYVDSGSMSLAVEPQVVVSGEEATFSYGVRNDGDRESVSGLVMALLVRREGDSEWTQVNQTKALRMPIDAGRDYTDPTTLNMNWSVPEDGAGNWDIMIAIDATNRQQNEIDEINNNLTWTLVHDNEYLEVFDKKADLVVQGIETAGQAYMGEPIAVNVYVAHDAAGGNLLRSADNVSIDLFVTDPDSVETQLMDNEGDLGVDLLGPTTFSYTWTPTVEGLYIFRATVDPDDEIEEWNDENQGTNNNELRLIPIVVKEKLSDLKVLAVTVSPTTPEGDGIVGVRSTITANIANQGLRNLTGSEASKLKVGFYKFTVDPEWLIAEVPVPGGLDLGQTKEVNITYIFEDVDTYEIIAMVDHKERIPELQPNGEDNNEKSVVVTTRSSIDAWVRDFSVPAGLTGRNHPITFEVGFDNLPVDTTRRLFFNVSYAREVGPGEPSIILEEPGDSYNLIVPSNPRGGGYVDLNDTSNTTLITLAWFPEAGDNYTFTVTIKTPIDTNDSNNEAVVNVTIERLTLNLFVESITTVGDSVGPVKIKVKVALVDDGRNDGLTGVKVNLTIYRYDESTFGTGALVKNLGNQTLLGELYEGDPLTVTFDWQAVSGTFIMIAEVDPGNVIREADEQDNIYSSTKITITVSGTGLGNGKEDDGSFLPAPSLLAAVGVIGLLALLRRRR